MTPCSDLRSDTITQPTAAMREAMMNAPLGDDVLGDDPTVLELQRRMADLLGKEESCFVPSGTMANQIAIRTQTQPGDEILCHDDSHIYRYEAGGPAALSGCSFAFLPGQRGMFEADTIDQHVRIDDAHFPNSSLLVVENTQNRGGGAPWPMDQLAAVTQRAHELGLKRHLDGARLWNASVATGETPKSIASHFDTVSTCFSKGLGAPVGSIIAGDTATIARAHRFRKMLGGAMRQSGLLAAAALYAIDHHVQRLTEDHERARRLAEAIAGCNGLSVDASTVETNIVYFDIDNAPEFVKALDAHGVRMLDLGPTRVRAVTSLAIDDDGIDHAIKVLQDLTS